MRGTRLGMLILFLLGLGLLVSALLLVMASRRSRATRQPNIDPATAGEIYGDRMEATKALLATGQLEPGGR